MSGDNTLRFFSLQHEGADSASQSTIEDFLQPPSNRFFCWRPNYDGINGWLAAMDTYDVYAKGSLSYIPDLDGNALQTLLQHGSLGIGGASIHSCSLQFSNIQDASLQQRNLPRPSYRVDKDEPYVSRVPCIYDVELDRLKCSWRRVNSVRRWNLFSVYDRSSVSSRPELLLATRATKSRHICILQPAELITSLRVHGMSRLIAVSRCRSENSPSDSVPPHLTMRCARH